LTGGTGLWLPIGVMNRAHATATAATTAAAVVVAMPSSPVAAMSYGTWFTKAVKHANKRLTRPPCEVSH
jgi:hypothetical protein